MYCDDIRQLYKHVQTSSRNPYDNHPYSSDVIRNIKDAFVRLQRQAVYRDDLDDEPAEVVPYSSHLSRRLTDLMAALYHPNNIERFKRASDAQFSVFVAELARVGVLSDNERARMVTQADLDHKKVFLVDLLKLKIDNDPRQIDTPQGRLSQIAVSTTMVYNHIFGE